MPFNYDQDFQHVDFRQHPERYRDLLVRVATYSAYFVELSRELQDDIIARFEFSDIG